MTPAPTTHELERCSTCGRYGWHSTERCPDAPCPDVAPPAGSLAGEWEDDEEPTRIIYGQRHVIGAYVTGAWACQQSDGSIQGNDGHDVYIDEMDEHGYQCERLSLSVVEARQLAQALLAAAAEVDGWAAR